MWTNAVRTPPAARTATALTQKAPSAAAVRRDTGSHLAGQGLAQVSRVEQGPENLRVGGLGKTAPEVEAGLRDCGRSLETGHLG